MRLTSLFVLSLLILATFPAQGQVGDHPSSEEIARTEVSLPFILPTEDRSDCQHLIFWDNTGQANRSSYHEPLWKKQAAVLRQRLKTIGADPKNTHIIPVKSPQDFLVALKERRGNKRLYVFGHGAPFVIRFGSDSVRVADLVESLKTEQVSVICHYGCRFVGDDAKELESVQSKLDEGQELVLYGHTEKSNKTDDSPWDLQNPLRRCEVNKSGVKTQKAAERLVLEFAHEINPFPAPALPALGF